MTLEEKTIAQAAIKAPHCNTYEDVYSRISKATGVPEKEVKSAVKRLAADFVLKECGGPAHDAPGENVGKPAEAWYEKGDVCKD
jgi:hypothetical protein